jgi:3,4-dihydroxy 2-butanone 4-phosphate synthase / GTP cyclohydrolase II
MPQTLLSRFGNPIQRVEKALNSLQRGDGVIVTDDENRENEGDLIFAAQSITTNQMVRLIRECSGIVCLCLPAEKAQALGLHPMVQHNTSRFGTAFTVSIDAAGGVTTGVSAADRVATVKAVIADNAVPADLRQPGHMFPITAAIGGVLKRRGHTEATVDLPRLAGLKPYGLLCELMNADGSMSRLPELVTYAENHGIVVITIDDLVAYRLSHESLVYRVVEAKLPTKYGEFRAVAYKSDLDSAEHAALVMGDIRTLEPVPVRIESECPAGEIFNALDRAGGEQLESALRTIAQANRGVVIFLRRQGNSLGLQDKQLDSETGNHADGTTNKPDDYAISTQIIKDLGISSVRFLTD